VPRLELPPPPTAKYWTEKVPVGNVQVPTAELELLATVLKTTMQFVPDSVTEAVKVPLVCVYVEAQFPVPKETALAIDGKVESRRLTTNRIVNNRLKTDGFIFVKFSSSPEQS
jgi:hypothetical protein